MTPEEIKAKSTELAAFYAAKSNGKTLQFLHPLLSDWRDHVEDGGPDLKSDLSRWRVKQEPRRMWETPSATPFRTDSYVRTYHQDEADKWKSKGCTVTEWQEVLP